MEKEVSLYDKKKHKYSIANNIDYKNCIEFYKSKDNRELKEYLENKKQEGTISPEEVEFWEGAMEIGTVQDICRTAVTEYHEQDRKTDPLKVKMARAILKSEKYIEEEQNAQKRDNRELFNGVYMIGYSLKEIITQKIKNKDKSINEIMDSIDYEEMEQKQNALYTKMHDILEKIRNFSKSDVEKNAYTAWDYYKGKFMVSQYEIVSEYDEIQMEKYVKEFEEKQLQENINSDSEKKENNDEKYNMKDNILSYNKEQISESDLKLGREYIEETINHEENSKDNENKEGLDYDRE